MSINRVIEKNNAAVAMMKSGDYDNAISSFVSALKKNQLHQGRPNQATHKRCLEPLHTSLDKCIVQSQGRVSFPEEQENNEHYMHRQGIFIPFNLDSKCIPSVLIFNLALAHQLSTKDSDKRLDCLKKAKKLYELAYNCQGTHEATELDSSMLFIMATVNNLGLIHNELNDHETSRKCFDHLLSVAMFLVDSKTTQHTDHIDAFLRNVTIANSDNCPAAAA